MFFLSLIFFVQAAEIKEELTPNCVVVPSPIIEIHKFIRCEFRDAICYAEKSQSDKQTSGFSCVKK